MHVANMRPGRAYSYSSRRDHPIHDTYKTSQNTIQCMIMLTSCMIVTPCRRVITRTRTHLHRQTTRQTEHQYKEQPLGACAIEV